MVGDAGEHLAQVAPRVETVQLRRAARGGERATALYSLIGTTKLNDLDPEKYLRRVLTRIADYPINRIADLLPWNVAPQLQTPERLAA